MSDNGFWAGVLIASSIAVGVYYTRIDNPPPIGRYQIITYPGLISTAFLLDTTNGNTWSYVFTHVDEKTGKPNIWVWEKLWNIDTDLINRNVNKEIK